MMETEESPRTSHKDTFLSVALQDHVPKDKDMLEFSKGQVIAG